LRCGNCEHFQDEMTEADGFTHGYVRRLDESGLHDKGKCTRFNLWKWSDDPACGSNEDNARQLELFT